MTALVSDRCFPNSCLRTEEGTGRRKGGRGERGVKGGRLKDSETQTDIKRDRTDSRERERERGQEREKARHVETDTEECRRTGANRFMKKLSLN